MVLFSFIYMKNIYEIKENNKSKLLNEILSSYISFIDIKYDNILFLYKGKNLNDYKNKKIYELNNENLIISVYNLETKKDKNIINNILCPQCKSLPLVNINDKGISQINCINNHQFFNLSLDAYFKFKNLEEKIKCHLCKNLEYYYDTFYICSCNNYICPLCFKKHLFINNSNKHTLVKYINRFCYCKLHNINFISYCKTCKNNLCQLCEEEHNKKHDIILFKQIMPNSDKINEIKNEIELEKSLLDEYEQNIQNLINYTSIYLKNKLSESNMIYDTILHFLDNLNNYQNINNINNINIKKINKDLNKYYDNIINIFYEFKKEFTIVYKKTNNNKIKLFNEEFVNNNKDKCFLEINKKRIGLCEFYDLKYEDILFVKLIEKNKINDKSYMFYECDNLYFLPDFQEWISKTNIDKIDINNMFYNNNSLIISQDIFDCFFNSEFSRINIMIYGSSCVGKTNFINKLIYGSFEEQFISTLGIDEYQFKINIMKKNLILNFFDTDGREKSSPLVSMFFNRIDIFIILFIADYINSFYDLDRQINMIREQKKGKYNNIVLISNFCKNEKKK